MKNCDSPVLFMYPPDELSDESIHAISEFMHEMCRSFEQYYHGQLTRFLDAQETLAQEQKYTGHNSEKDEPF